MQLNPKIAVLPAYQPEQSMLEIVRKLSESGFEIVVIDDGSGALYRSLFEQVTPIAHLVQYDENHGKGYALKQGFLYIQQNYQPHYSVVTLDADGQHRVEDALRIGEAVEQNPSHLILGSRSFDENVPFRSQLGNTFTRWVYRLSTGISVRDTQTGLRGFSNELLEFMLNIQGDRYEYEMNMLLDCTREKIQIQELDIPTIYHDNNSGSHFSTIKDSARIYKEILKFSASSFFSFLLDYGLFALFNLVFGFVFGTWSLVFANVASRIISATVNFTLNRKLVFRSDKNLLHSALQYILLAIIILIGNTFVLNLLVNHLMIASLLAKIITEVAFFLGSWFVQRTIIFRKKKSTAI